MSPDLFARFTGLAHARETFAAEPSLCNGAHIAIIDEGKNAWAVRLALHKCGCQIVDDERTADLLVIGTLSPGPMLDALQRRRADPVTQNRPVWPAWTPLGAAASQAIAVS